MASGASPSSLHIFRNVFLRTLSPRKNLPIVLSDNPNFASAAAREGYFLAKAKLITSSF
jgi:hypothetical protein